MYVYLSNVCESACAQVCMYVYVCMCTHSLGDQKRVSELLPLKLSPIVNYLKGVFRSKLMPSGRATSTLKLPISLATKKPKGFYIKDELIF